MKRLHYLSLALLSCSLFGAEEKINIKKWKNPQQEYELKRWIENIHINSRITPVTLTDVTLKKENITIKITMAPDGSDFLNRVTLTNAPTNNNYFWQYFSKQENNTFSFVGSVGTPIPAYSVANNETKQFDTRKCLEILQKADQKESSLFAKILLSGLFPTSTEKKNS